MTPQRSDGTSTDAYTQRRLEMVERQLRRLRNGESQLWDSQIETLDDSEINPLARALYRTPMTSAVSNAASIPLAVPTTAPSPRYNISNRNHASQSPRRPFPSPASGPRLTQ